MFDAAADAGGRRFLAFGLIAIDVIPP